MSKAPAKTQIVSFRLKLHACDTERMRGTIEKEENGSTENLFFSSPSLSIDLPRYGGAHERSIDRAQLLGNLGF